MSADELRDFGQTLNKIANIVEAKENPAGPPAGLSNDSDQADWINGNDFASAFRVVSQAHDIIREIADTWAEFDRGRPVESAADWERNAINRAIGNATAIYRECYRAEIVREFKMIFGVDYETFETSLLQLRHHFGDA